MSSTRPKPVTVGQVYGEAIASISAAALREAELTDAEYILALIDETFAYVPEVKRHHERLRAIAARLKITGV